MKNVTLSPQAVAQLKKELAPVNKLASKLLKRCAKVRNTIKSVIKNAQDNPIPPPKIVDGLITPASTRQVLQAIQEQRTEVTRAKLLCLQSNLTAKRLLCKYQDWLMANRAVASLSNAPLRQAAMRQLYRPVEHMVDSLGCDLERLDTLLWYFKDNQRAVETQVRAWSDMS